MIVACDFRVPLTTAMCVSFAENTAGRNVLDTTQLGYNENYMWQVTAEDDFLFLVIIMSTWVLMHAISDLRRRQQ